MSDSRYTALARLLIHHSCELQPGEKVLIEAIDVPHTFVRELIRTAAAAGALPLVQLQADRITRELLFCASEEQLRVMAEADALRMSQVDAYIGLRGKDNISELSDVPAANMKLYESLYREPVHMDLRVGKTRWVVLRWPNGSMAQQARMSTEAFEDFYFRVCTLDYQKMSQAMDPLRDLMNATDRVHLKAPGTDLRFSIQGIPAIKCDGHRNIPDGEVFTSPVRDSVEGMILFNTGTVYRDVVHENVQLSFREGRIVDAQSSESEALEAVLDSDEGARYIGEFAIGFNPHITRPMHDILFDEKIAGSIHFTPGKAYEDADNGNRSQIHWDLVLRMTPDVGGGEIWFDDRLIRKDGRFVIPELEALNPERLIG